MIWYIIHIQNYYYSTNAVLLEHFIHLINAEMEMYNENHNVIIYFRFYVQWRVLGWGLLKLRSLISPLPEILI